MKPFYISILYLLCLSISCSKSDEGTSSYEGPGHKPPKLDTNYTNPVFEPVIADPSVVRGDDKWFYVVGTEDNWGDGKSNHLLPVIRSKNLMNWEFVKDALPYKPQWKNSGFLWAPDICKVNGKYHIYYSYSLWGDTNPGVGLAIADTPGGPFTDLGKLFLSNEVNVPNSIDPFYIEENGKKYLFWGSYSTASNQGTYAIELSDDGKSIPDLTKKTKIAAGDFEGVMIHKRNGYYYFFGSKGGCCDGAASTYNVRVGRSENLLGPYKDRDNNLLTTRGSGVFILGSNEIYAGPGHNARIVTDDEGTDWLLYHAILKTNPYISGNSGASKRPLMLDKVNWDNNWPSIAGSGPSNTQQKGPVFDNIDE